MNQRRSFRISAPLQAGLVAVLLLGCEAAPTVGGDYLSPDLRAKVEQLKIDRAAAPTSSANVYERVDILWEWANAYALTGGPLPVNFALDTAIMRWAEADGSPPDVRLVADVELNTVEDYVPYIDRYLEELQIKDEDPGALGSLRVVPDEPLLAGSKATVELVYEVGNMPMQVGGGVLAGRQWLADVNDFQNQDPAAPNYLTARTSRPDARLEAVMVPLVGPHGSQRFPKPTPAFRLVGAPLEPGDTITVTYGDRSGGSAGIGVQAFETDALLLPLYIDLQGNGNWLTPKWPSLTVIGGAVAGVRVLAPSVVAVGETFDLTVRSEDAGLNRASGPLPGYEILLNGEVVAEVAAPESAVAIAGGLTIQEPGTYRFVVRSTDGTLEATSNPIWVEAEPERRILWGETHGHTGFAEGQGSPAGYFRYGVEDARLDFLTLSEHDFWLDDYEWQQLQEFSRRTTEAGRAIAFLGYEWTPTRKRGGHHNVLFRSPDRERVPVQEAHRLPLLWEGLRAANDPADVLVIPHAHSAGDWTQSDGELERVVEIYSEHGTFEWFGNMFLKNGFEVGFLAASDDHRAKPGAPQGHFQASLIGVPGLAAVRAGEKTADAIFDALRERSVYAVSGQRILLDAELNGYPMGVRQPQAEQRRIVARVSGTSPIDRMEVIKNGEVAFSRSYLSAPLSDRSWLQLGFESSSEVFTLDAVDNPRPFRVWRGTLRVRGARVLDVVPVGLDNRVLDWIETEDAGVFRFDIRTRGRSDTVLLGLAGATASTTLDIELEPTREYGIGQGHERPAMDIPGASIELRLAGLRDNRLEREVPFGEHIDRVTLQVVEPDAPLDREFEYLDMGPAAPGDYYYVRVTQLDGGQAWSSPFWVGRRTAASQSAAGARP